MFGEEMVLFNGTNWLLGLHPLTLFHSVLQVGGFTELLSEVLRPNAMYLSLVLTWTPT